MKVIAIKDSGTYICEVTHTEIEKHMNLYYNNMPRLREGSAMDLGEGYEFHQKTVAALRETRKFIDENKKVIECILNGVSLVSRVRQPKKETSK